jgi:phosphoglycerol transferase MdoB-like AlkP superfamily enzyme
MVTSPVLNRFRPLLFLSLFYLGLSFVLRLVLWKVFGAAAGVSWGALASSLGVGLVNDLVVLVFLNLPATLYLTFLPERSARSRWQKICFVLILFFTVFGLFYQAGAEFFFFEEFDARFNLVAVDYLIYPHEVLINIWESYPVVRILLVDTLLSSLLLGAFWPRLRTAFAVPTRLWRRMGFAGAHLLLLLPALLLSTDSLDFSGNRVTNELTHNGVSSLFRAFRTNHLDYNAYYRTMPVDQAFLQARAELKGDGDFASADPQNLNRIHPSRSGGLGRVNVVVIVEESLSASYSGLFGNPESLTPNLDALGEKGMLFSQAYASGTRTVRGLEAISTSLPPIPSEAVVKRPGNENIANWGEVMQGNGYHSSFLYGGYGAFDNMNYFFGNNGFAISDRGDIPDPAFTNIWGVSDGDLFNHALDYYDGLAQEKKPFFSIIMSTSNHRPYTFPEGIPGIPSSGGGRRAGVRYADYALGEFLQQAGSHSWFDQTLFVIVADHCARVYGRAEIPVATYHIPLVFFAPALLTPSRVALPIGQIDIAPTVLGLLGLPYTAPFYGQDVLNGDGDPKLHPLFMNHNHDVAMMVGDRLTVLGLQQSADLYRYDRQKERQSPLPADRELFDRATAVYQSAYDLYINHRYQ